MSNQQRIQTVKIVWDGDEAKSKMVTFTTSVKGADEAIKDLNTMMGENAVVTSKIVKSAKEETRERNRQASAVVRSYNKSQRLITSLKQELSVGSKTADQQEKLAALYRLGANATLSQKKEVVKLISAMQAQRTESGKVGGSMRNLRGQAQNVGWQMQDIAVQMQMGTDKMVIFSQQGSQLASGFGPGGALIGALIAVGGAIAGVALNSKAADAALKKMKERVDELTKSLVELNGDGKTSDLDKQINADTATVKLKELNKQLTSYQEKLVKAKQIASQETVTITDAYSGSSYEIVKSTEARKKEAASVNKLTGQVKALGDEIKANEAVVKGATTESTKSNQAIKDQIKELKLQIDMYGQSAEAIENEQYRRDGANGARVTELELLQQTLARKKEESEQEALRDKQLSDLVAKAEAAAKKREQLAKKQIEQNKRAVNSIEEQAFALNKERSEITEHSKQKAINNLIMNNGTTAQIKATENAYNAIIATQKQVEAEARKTKALQASAKAQREAEAAQKLADKESKRRTNVLNRAENQIWKDGGSDPVADETRKHDSLKSSLEAEIKLIEDRMKAGDVLSRNELSDLMSANELLEAENDRHLTAMTDAEIAQMETRLQLASEAASMLTTTVDLITNGTEEVKEQTADMNGAQKAMFFMTQSLAAASALVSGMSLGMKLAEMFPTAAPAMITTGTALGAAQAGAIMGTTFAGMFDKGGTIPSGQAGLVAEQYDEMVGGTMVYNNSGSGLNVTGSKDTAAMMNGGGVNVTVVNNATGTVTASVKQLGENDIQIMIAEHFNNNIDKGVASTINKKGSKADKAMRSSYTGTNRRL